MNAYIGQGRRQQRSRPFGVTYFGRVLQNMERSQVRHPLNIIAQARFEGRVQRVQYRLSLSLGCFMLSGKSGLLWVIALSLVTALLFSPCQIISSPSIAT